MVANDLPDDQPSKENQTVDRPDWNVALAEDDPIALVQRVHQLWWRWADFGLFVVHPALDVITPPRIIPPMKLADSDESEFVYPIHDYGYKLMTSKGSEMYSAGLSMCRLYFTIEKMIYLLIERLKSESGEEEDGKTALDAEVQIAFSGFDGAQRKAFESVINLPYNVIVTNFEPGEWGERYLEIVKRLADKGYGYPSESPRDIFQQSRASGVKAKR